MIDNVTVELSLSTELKNRTPKLALAAVSANVRVEKHNPALWQKIDQRVQHLTATIKPDQIATAPSILAMRNAYKALGKDPSRYRGSAEALLRRVVSGKGVYQVNNVVDINNLVSLETLQPAGSYDLKRISNPIELRIGHSGEIYRGIGKEMINIEKLPVFADSEGPFGSPTSDSERAMIRPETSRVLMVVFSFAGEDGLEAAATRARDLLQKYANATDLRMFFVS